MIITKIMTNLRNFLKPPNKRSKKNQTVYISESDKRSQYLFQWYPNLLPGETVEWTGVLCISISGCSSGNLHDPRLVYFTSQRIVWRFYGRETGYEPFTEIPYNKIRYIQRFLGSFLGGRSDNANELYVDFDRYANVTFIDYSSDLNRCEQIIRTASSFHGEVKECSVF